MKKKRIWALITALCLTCTVGFGMTGTQPIKVSAADSLSEIQQKQKEIQKKLDQAKSDLNSVNKQIGAEKQKQEALDNQISLNQQKINILQQSISAMNADIEDKNNQIAQKEEDIQNKELEITDTYEAFKKRMRAMYMAGENSSLEMLLSAESFSDFLTNAEMMKAISAHDQQLVDDLRTQKAAIEEEKAGIEQDKAAIEQRKQEIIIQREDIKATQSELEQAYAQSEDAMQDYDALKDQYENNRDAALAEEKAVEQELQNWYKTHSSSSSDGSTANSQFIWPLPGYSRISSPYGSRWGGFHTGMDITGGGVFGASIVAAASGTVIQSTSHYSYGNYVIIDHGGGYSTLYAHASQLLVSVGQKVEQGQTIAKVGSTGNSTGPHLHFEVRVNGQHKNPANYVHA